MDILWENPIILVIIVGIISSYFKKMKSEQPENGDNGKPNQRKVPPVSVGPVARNKKRQRAENQRVQQQYAQIKPVNTGNDRNDKLDQRTNNRSLVENNSESLIYNNQNALQANQVPGELNTIQIDKDKLIDGIIWSEILGPPRSKRPHRSIKNN